MLVVGPDFCIKENGPVKSSYKMNFFMQPQLNPAI